MNGKSKYMKELILKAEKRENIGGSNPRNIRKESYIPAIVYGPKLESINIKVKKSDLNHIFKSSGEGNAISLDIDGAIHHVFIHDLQKDVLTDDISHVDFYQFDKNKKFSIEIPLVFEGESKIVKEAGAVLQKELDSVTVEGLYDDLIQDIKIDLSKLENINDVVYISDLDIPEKLKVLNAQDQVIVVIKPIRAKVEEVVEETVPTETSTEESKEETKTEEKK